MVANITGFTTRSDGNKITASIWNSELGGIYTYINNTIVPAFNLLAAKGDLLSSNGTDLVSVGGALVDGHTLQWDSGEASGMRWASPGGLPTTTKGDLIVHDGTTNDRLASGGAPNNGKVLTLDSTQPLGMKWDAPGGTYASADLNLVSGGSYNLAHGLGAIPRQCWFSLICTVATDGYSIGDIVFTYADVIGAAANFCGMTVYANATHVKAIVSVNGLRVISATTGSLVVADPANYKLRIYAQS